ncbi:hypothetical protein V2W45_1204521, partial [Cenococcum geophilum]
SITTAANESIPKIKPGGHAKPWWTDELKELRASMNAKCRNKTLDSPSTVRAWCNARNTYAAAIKRAKREHWNQFLEKEDPKIIFKAIKYTKNNRIRRIPNIKGKDGVQ